jgi:hypothetical protein
MTCPFHVSPRGDVTNFAINIESGLWTCRSPACGLHGYFPLFYKLMEGIATWAEVRQKLERSAPIRNWQELLSFQSKSERAPEIRHQELPPDVFHTKITKENFPPYLRETRKYDETLLELGYDLRWCFGGDYRNRILFPFYDMQGELLTFTARLMNDESQDDRYRFPDGATTNQFLFGIHRANNYSRIERLFVVEGQFDVMRLATLGEFAVGISKGIISARQLLDVKRLCDLYLCPAIVCLDKGAFDGTVKIWLELCSLGVKAKFVDISSIAKDPDGLDTAKLIELKAMVRGNDDPRTLS